MNRRKFIQTAVGAAAVGALAPALATPAGPVIPEVFGSTPAYGLNVGGLVSYQGGVYRVTEVSGNNYRDDCWIRIEKEFEWNNDRPSHHGSAA